MPLTGTSMPDAGEKTKYWIGNSNSKKEKNTNVSILVPPVCPSVCGE